jgi:hypothetical protein
MNSGSNLNFKMNEVGEPVWNIRIWNYTKRGYSLLHEDFIYGVRGGSSYSNGVAGGNIDSIPGDELVISTFPNFYVFKYDKAKKKLNPLWLYPYSFANTALIHDFDKNGTKEFGFATFNKTEFWEFLGYGNKPASPLAFRGYSLSDTSALFKWNKSAGVDHYQLYKLIQPTPGQYALAPIITSTADSVIISGLEKSTDMDFYLTAIAPNSASVMAESEPAGPVGIYCHSTISPQRIVVRTHDQFELIYSGKLPKPNVEVSNFKISNKDFPDLYDYFISNAVTINDSTLLLSMPLPMPNGEYNISAESFPDYYGSPTAWNPSIPFKIDLAFPEIELFLHSLDVISSTELKLKYSENVSIGTATILANYTLYPYGIVNDVVINPSDESEVNVILDNSKPLTAIGINYSITVRNVESATGKKITTGAGNTLTFAFSASDLEKAFVYPSPIKYSDNPAIMFGGLPLRAEVEILTLDGETVTTVIERDGNGGVEWDGLDKKGEKLTPNVYLFKVTKIETDGSKGESIIKKFVIIP